MAKTILLEFNELCPSLMEDWIAAGKLPNFARLRGRSAEFLTDPDVDDATMLEPWIQWYSVHTGLAYDQHRVFHLTDGPKAGFADLYSTMIAQGRSVGCFAGMNVAPFAADGSFYVGDPWSEDQNAHPAALNTFNRFVGHNVREYSNPADRIGLGDYVQFLSFMAANGLSTDTVSLILRQLASERIEDQRLSYKRVAILDRLQFDVFRAFYRRKQPEFASFFLNSTAHLQHSYWRHMAPDQFSVRPGPDELAIYGDAIEFGYRMMDRLIGEFADLARKHGARLILVTALSQQPFLKHEERGGQNFYRLRNPESFFSQLGLHPQHIDPTMTHQYVVRFGSGEERNAARTLLRQLMLDGKPVFGLSDKTTIETELYFGCEIFGRVDADQVIVDQAGARSIPFFDLLYRMEALKSGRHHPTGMLWVETGRHQPHAGPVSILDVFPTILDLHGISAPTVPTRRGRSLVPAFADTENRQAA